MRYLTSIVTLLLLLTGCVPQGSAGPQGPPGKDGAAGLTGKPGIKGMTGPMGPAGSSVPADQLKKVEAFLAQNNESSNEYIVAIESITLVWKISDHHDFISLSRIAYGEDIKQYFVAATKSGMVFTTDDLKTWKSQGNISLK